MIENVNGTNVKNIQPNKISQSVEANKQVIAPPTKENGKMLLYASLAGLATLAAVGGYAIKACKFGGVKNYYPNGILHEEAGCKFYFKGGKLYDEVGNLVTTTLKKESPNGRIMYTDYVEGVVTTRHFSPADKTQIKEIAKNYDSKTYEGIKTVKTEITNADGNIKHTFNAVSLAPKFPPEIEAKIKMKDFDKLKLEDINFDKKDLGDGVVLAKTVGDGIKLQYNGKTIRRKTFANKFQTITDKNGVQIMKDGDNFCSMTVEKLNEINIYNSDGIKTIIKKAVDKDGKEIMLTTEYNVNGAVINSKTVAL